MLTRLTKKQIREYVKSGGVKCPYCGSEGISAGNLILDSSDNVMSNVQCFNCKKEWREVYTLTDMIELCQRCGSDIEPGFKKCSCREATLNLTQSGEA